MPGRQADGAASAVPDPALKARTPHEPVTRLAEQARRVVAFHVPPASSARHSPGTGTPRLDLAPAQATLRPQRPVF